MPGSAPGAPSAPAPPGPGPSRNVSRPRTASRGGDAASPRGGGGGGAPGPERVPPHARGLPRRRTRPPRPRRPRPLRRAAPRAAPRAARRGLRARARPHPPPARGPPAPPSSPPRLFEFAQRKFSATPLARLHDGSAPRTRQGRGGREGGGAPPPRRGPRCAGRSGGGGRRARKVFVIPAGCAVKPVALWEYFLPRAPVPQRPASPSPVGRAVTPPRARARSMRKVLWRSLSRRAKWRRV